jgi:hypothetical protein
MKFTTHLQAADTAMARASVHELERLSDQP